MAADFHNQLVSEVKQGNKITLDQLKKCFENPALADLVLHPAKFAELKSNSDNMIDMIRATENFNAQFKDGMLTGAGVVFGIQVKSSGAPRDIAKEVEMKDIDKLNALTIPNRKAAMTIDSIQAVLNMNLSGAELMAEIKKEINKKIDVDPKRVKTAVEGLATSTSAKQDALIQKIYDVNLSMLDKIEDHRGRLIALNLEYASKPVGVSGLLSFAESQLTKEIQKCDGLIKELESNIPLIEAQKKVSKLEEDISNTRSRSNSSSQSVVNPEEVEIEVRRPGMRS